MKIVGKSNKGHFLGEVVVSQGDYYMVVYIDEIEKYAFLNIQTGEIQGKHYATLDDLAEDNDSDIHVKAVCHIE